MNIADLAKKCGTTIEEVVSTISIQFNDDLPLNPYQDVPDKYVGRVLYLYEVLPSEPSGDDYIPQEEYETEPDSAYIDDEEEPYDSDEFDIEDTEDSDDYSGDHTVKSVAAMTGYSIDRTKRVLANLYDYDLSVSSDEPVEDYVFNDIETLHIAITAGDSREAFERIFILPAIGRWDVNIEPRYASHLKPGTIAEGCVTEIDCENRIARVKFTYETGFFFTSINEKYGNVSFDEWDWSINSGTTPDIKKGSKYPFKILSHPESGSLKISRRLAIEPPKPKEKETAFFVGSYHQDGFYAYRTESGVYGYINAVNLLYQSESSDFPGEIEVFIRNKYSKRINGKDFYYAEFGVADEESSQGNKNFIRMLMGLSKLKECENVPEIFDWDDFVAAFKDKTPILAKITDTNDGGYLMTAVDEDDIELFCPYSRAPTWVDKYIADRFIGKEWLVEIKSDPEDEERNNTIVYANRKSDQYYPFVDVNSFYEAIVCGINDGGANLLIDGTVPVFLPNPQVSWKHNVTARQELKVGQVVVIKLWKNGEGELLGSMRDAVIEPWQVVSNVIPIYSVIDARIVKKEEKYVILSYKGYKVYLPAEKISWTENVKDCRGFHIPEVLRVLVTGYNDKERSINVSVRDLNPDPWAELDKHLSKNDIEKAVVSNIELRGVYLKVGVMGFEGFLSYRDVDWCRYLDKSTFRHSVGDTIEVKITRRDIKNRKLLCSVKDLTANPWESLRNGDSIEGMVLKVEGKRADVRLENDIECVCHEALSPELEGSMCQFKILTVNAAAQQIAISHRKPEIEAFNTLAIGEMFKEYRSLTHDEKALIAEEPEIYRDFTIKEVSSTGRVTATYAEDDGEYENGILLPGALTINGRPVNIIFARQIIKQYLIPGHTFTFRISHRYTNFSYAVLAIDAVQLLELDSIATDDKSLMLSRRGVECTVLHDMTTDRNAFVEWNSYFGYIPRAEIGFADDNMPETVRARAVVSPVHPEQMIRFALVDDSEIVEEQEDKEAENEIAKELDAERFACYEAVQKMPGFDSNRPDFYPHSLQIRYNPEQFPQLDELQSSAHADFANHTFFLDCYRTRDSKGAVLTIFDNEFSLSAFCREREDGEEIRINECDFDQTDIHRHYSKPLRIAGENLQIIPINSSALPTSGQSVDNIMELLKYNREVLPELIKLNHGNQRERGAHYLTLKDMVNMDIKREDEYSDHVITINTSIINADAGNLGGSGLVFEADDAQFILISSKDDPQDGFMVYIKANDGTAFDKSTPKGRLSNVDSCRWRVDLYKNFDLDIDELRKVGIQIKRYANVRHLKKQIVAIDSFVFERNGLDIFSKILRKKLKPVIPPDPAQIEANPNFNLYDEADSQAKALKMALGGSQITLIQGPPGTGKSTVIVDIIRNLVAQGKKVLVCTQSVAPIEELYFKISGRKGGENKKEPLSVRDIAIRSAYLGDDGSIESYGGVDELRNKLKNVSLLIDNLGKVNSSTNPENIEEMKIAEARLSDGKALTRIYAKEIMPHHDDIENILHEYIHALDREDVETISTERLNLEAVDVVFGTCIGVGVSHLLDDVHFDTLIIDEAGKANYAESLVPMMMADEYILVGDDRQLPPYTNSELVTQLAEKRLKDGDSACDLETEKAEILKDVGKSLFGDLKPRLPESNRVMLSKQYRMHPDIGDFVSRLFYDGKVESACKADDRNLNIKELEHPIKFIDTSGMGKEAWESRLGTSLCNDGEIRVIEEMLLPVLRSALESGKTVGILSPYGAHVKKMQQRFPELKEHIFTIDSIQGEEYDIVVFSFVRTRGPLNFVDDLRRLNVSFSRAKCNLIMVGHLDTLMNEEVHKIDRDAVMSVYNEIESKHITKVTHRGAMQLLYEDFPPESHPLVHDLDRPYYEFEKCSLKSRLGEFTTKYRGKSLQVFNPMLKKLKNQIPVDEPDRCCKAYLLGFRDDKPYTMISPIGLWLKEGCTLNSFELSAAVVGFDKKDATLRLHDGSMISLSVPNLVNLSEGMKVKVAAYKKKTSFRFTIKPADNE